jgi:hypothetical protein
VAGAVDETETAADAGAAADGEIGTDSWSKGNSSMFNSQFSSDPLG